MSDTSGEKAVSKVEMDWHYCHHVVAYLDILGQKEAFKDVKGVPREINEKAKLNEALKKTVTFISYFRKGFKNYFDGLAQSTVKEAALPTEFREEFFKLRRTSISMYGLSDAVVAWTSLMGDKYYVGLNSLYGILMASAGMFILSLACKHAIRGGIDLDGAITLEPGSGEIYGPALNRAYQLEKCRADYPRILVGDGVMNYLKAMHAVVPEERAMKHSKNMAARCRQLIFKDTDGAFAVDYLGSHVLQTWPAELPEKEVLIPARQFVRDELERWRREGDQKLTERYEHVLAYFNERLPVLGHHSGGY